MLSGCATYRAGVALPDTDTPVSALAAAGHGRLVWISLHDPSVEECHRLAAVMHLDAHLTAALVDARPRAAIESVSGMTVVRAGVARYDTGGDQVEIGSLTCLSTDGVLVTVTRHTPSVVTDLRRSLEGREGTLSSGAGHVIWAHLDAAVASYGRVLGELRADVEIVERQAFGENRSATITQRIYRLKRETIDFQQATVGLIDPLEDLAAERVVIAGDHGLPDWEGTRDRLVRVVDRATAVGDLLNGVLTAFQTEVALTQNEDMRKISAWVAIAAVPTLLAGVYGMNFESMPELSYRYGYPILLGVMVVVCGGLYLAFRRRGWL